MGIGVLAAAGGLAMVISNSRTSVTQDVGGNQVRLLPPWIQTPTWNIAATEQKNLPPAMGIPLLGGRF
jgi:hypothetical protein